MKPEYPERQPPESDVSISPMKPSSDDSENIEDWLEMIEKKCGFDVEMEDNIEKGRRMFFVLKLYFANTKLIHLCFDVP